MRLGAFFFENSAAGRLLYCLSLSRFVACCCDFSWSGLLVLLVARLRERRFAKFPLFSLIISALFTLAALPLMRLFLSKFSQPCSAGAFAATGFPPVSGRAMMRVLRRPV